MTGYVVPIKAFFYIIAGLIIIFYHYDQIPEAFSLIFLVHLMVQHAGGFIGATVASAIQIGMARGVFANEAGLGSAPIAAAAAKLIRLQNKL